MRRNVYGLALCAMLFALCSSAAAQQPKKIPRIGLLYSVSASSGAPRNEAFRQGLRELGYVDGSNIILDYRYADSKLDRLPELAAELVRLKVDVIVTSGPGPTRSPRQQLLRFPL
jgi:putative ABC transport system substrate-binding protein